MNCHLMSHRCTALAPGTWRKRERHATRYVTHMGARGLDHLTPTAYDVAHYKMSLHPPGASIHCLRRQRPLGAACLELGGRCL